MRTLTVYALAGLAAVAPAQSEWHVSQSGNDANAGTSASSPFRTINRAVLAAANGDVVRIAAGIYGDEQGTISLGSKELTIFGAGIGATILRANSSIDQNLPTGPVSPTPTTAPHRVTLRVQGSSRIDLLDMTIDGAFRVPSHGRATCMFVASGADVSCDRVEFANARANPLDSSANAHGIVVRGDAIGDATTLTLRDCSVHDYGKSGVVASYEAYLELEDCRFDGEGRTSSSTVPQNGIRITSGASALLRRVTVTDHWYDSNNIAATAVSLLDCGNVAVADCNFGNCENGIFALRSTPGPMPVALRRNNISGAEVGIYVLNAQGIVAEGNSLHATRGANGAPATDSGSSNYWNGNYYSSLETAAPLAIAGSAGSIDWFAQPFLRGFALPEATPMPLGDAPIDVIAADLDGDGDRDFAALTTSPSGPALCVGLQLGGVYSVARIPFSSSSGRPIALVDGEFDGLPGRDIAALSARIPPDLTENKVTVFGNNGGVFASTQIVPLDNAINPTAMAAGELDGGIDDLVVTDAGASILWPGVAFALRNNGNATFQVTTLPLALAAAARDVAIADVDGDGSRDVAIAEGAPGLGRLHILRGNGAGAFTAWPTGPVTTTANLQSVAVADIDGDLDTDLVAACARSPFGSEPGALDVFENKGIMGFERTEHVVDPLPDTIAVGRLDGVPFGRPEGRDIAVVDLGIGGIHVLNRYVKDCGFAQGGAARAGTGAVSVTLADMNGDSLDDIVYADADARSVVMLRRVLLAQSDAYGVGTPGTASRTPVIRPIGEIPLPIVPTSNFGIGVVNALPNSLAVLAIGLSTTPNLINDLIVTFVNFTGTQGKADAYFSIPPDPYFVGIPLYCQAGVFDSNAQQGPLPGLALTQGLRLLMGL